MKKILCFCLLLLCISCSNNSTNVDLSQVEESQEEKDLCCCPPTIYLQPVDNFTQKEATRLRKELECYDSVFYYDIKIEILPTIKLGKNYLNESKTRYRADKILDSFKDTANDHAVYLIVTHKDISTTLRGYADWGVLGLSYRKKYVGVASTYRLNNRRDFWKVVIHEFAHAYYGSGHCSNENCIMADQKGHNYFSNKPDFCKSCKNKFHI